MAGTVAGTLQAPGAALWLRGLKDQDGKSRGRTPESVVNPPQRDFPVGGDLPGEAHTSSSRFTPVWRALLLWTDSVFLQKRFVIVDHGPPPTH